MFTLHFTGRPRGRTLHDGAGLASGQSRVLSSHRSSQDSLLLTSSVSSVPTSLHSDGAVLASGCPRGVEGDSSRGAGGGGWDAVPDRSSRPASRMRVSSVCINYSFSKQCMHYLRFQKEEENAAARTSLRAANGSILRAQTLRPLPSSSCPSLDCEHRHDSSQSTDCLEKLSLAFRRLQAVLDADTAGRAVHLSRGRHAVIWLTFPLHPY